jgi:hypothetical protein
MGKGKARAQSLLLKRKSFSHEDEVRIIWVCNDQRDDRRPLTVNVEPNSFIEEITFDPRLISFERLEREQSARALGYEGPFVESRRYMRTFFQTILPWDWDDWEAGAAAPKG